MWISKSSQRLLVRKLSQVICAKSTPLSLQETVARYYPLKLVPSGYICSQFVRENEAAVAGHNDHTWKTWYDTKAVEAASVLVTALQVSLSITLFKSCSFFHFLSGNCMNWF